MGQVCLFSCVSSNDPTAATKNLGRTERDPLIFPNSLMDLKLDLKPQYSCLGLCSRSDPLSWTLSAHHFRVPGSVLHQIYPDTCGPQCLPKSTLFPALGNLPSFFFLPTGDHPQLHTVAIFRQSVMWKTVSGEKTPLSTSPGCSWPQGPSGKFSGDHGKLPLLPVVLFVKFLHSAFPTIG